MTEYVRVRDKGTGHELTIRSERLDDPQVKAGVEVLKRDATDPNGVPLTPTYRVPKGSEPAPSAAQPKGA